MRVLCESSKHPLEYCVLEVIFACYDEDFHGLRLDTPDKEICYIPYLCREVCNDIIKHLYTSGVYDFTDFDSIVFYAEG